MTEPYDYVKDGAEIYRRSFATIEAEADLGRVPAELRPLVPSAVEGVGAGRIGRIDLTGLTGSATGQSGRQARMSSSVVRGFVMHSRSTVSPRHDVGTTKPI